MSNTRIHLRKLNEAQEALFKVKGHVKAWEERPNATGTQMMAARKLKEAIMLYQMASNEVYTMMDAELTMEMRKASQTVFINGDAVATGGRA